MSQIPEDELFKICLDFWHSLSYSTLMKLKGSQYYDNCKLYITGRNSVTNFSIDGGMNLQGMMHSSWIQVTVYPPILD
jgi:hypothetical protein